MRENMENDDEILRDVYGISDLDKSGYIKLKKAMSRVRQNTIVMVLDWVKEERQNPIGFAKVRHFGLHNEIERIRGIEREKICEFIRIETLKKLEPIKEAYGEESVDYKEAINSLASLLSVLKSGVSAQPSDTKSMSLRSSADPDRGVGEGTMM